MKKYFSPSYRSGFAPILVIGIIAAIVFVALVVFGPWELPGFGQLSQRQIDQAISAAEANSPTIPPNDSDQDGFSDEVEGWIRTDKADNCADNTNDAAWPPDFNNDKAVNMTDVDLLKAYFGQRVKGENNRRYDLNADKTINLSDVFLLRNFYGRGCPFYFITNTSHTPSSVTLNWAPALPNIAYPQLLQVYYGDMTGAQTAECSSTNRALTGSFGGALTNTDALPNYLKEGVTSYTWDSTASYLKPIPGHKYCIFFSYGDTREAGASHIVSRFVEVTTDPYDLRVNPGSTKADFSWAPSVVKTGWPTRLFIANITGKTCDINVLLNGTLIELAVGQSVLSWNYPSVLGPYCAGIFNGQGAYNFPNSNFVNFTIPTPNPTPTLWSQCRDGIDNDFDKLIDSADPGCSLGDGNWEYADSPTPVPSPTP